MTSQQIMLTFFITFKILKKYLVTLKEQVIHKLKLCHHLHVFRNLYDFLPWSAEGVFSSKMSKMHFFFHAIKFKVVHGCQAIFLLNNDF